MTDWLCKSVLCYDHDFEHVKDIVYRRFRELKIVPPTPERMDRFIRFAISTFEDQLFKETFEKLSKETISRLDSLIEKISDWNEDEQPSFRDLKADPGRTGLESVFKVGNRVGICGGWCPTWY